MEKKDGWRGKKNLKGFLFFFYMANGPKKRGFYSLLRILLVLREKSIDFLGVAMQKWEIGYNFLVLRPFEVP